MFAVKPSIRKSVNLLWENVAVNVCLMLRTILVDDEGLSFCCGCTCSSTSTARHTEQNRSRSSCAKVEQRYCKAHISRTVSSLWHIYGHMRLIRWGIVTHGGIDGYSWVITYLTASTDSTAQTVLAHFVGATCRYGLPSRVRSDHEG
ncbi:hypothetical protein MHYP_G00234740 [Metynnis hypsauchen]